MAHYDFPVVVNPLPHLPSATASKNELKESELGIHALTTVGLLGVSHEPLFVAGEKVLTTIMFTGLSRNADGKAALTFRRAVMDSDSVIIDKSETSEEEIDLLESHSRTILSTCRIAPNTKPGRYMLQFSVTDNVAQKTATKDIEITLVDGDRFDLCGFELGYDSECNCPSSPNLTVGQIIYSKCQICVPKSAAGHEMQIQTSFLDAQKKELSRAAASKYVVPDAEPFNPPTCKTAFLPNRPGFYFVRTEMTDMTAKKIVTKDLPIHVFARPEIVDGKDGLETKLKKD
jgi:hypothetical protein